ncbi:MAG: hypothetical protein WD670_01955, partial [Actinomycetota bacterium]
MPAGRRRPLIPLAVVFVLLATVFSSSAAAVEPPSLRLFVADSEITVQRGRNDFVFIDPGAWITPVGDDFKLVVSRPDYDTPITIKQVDAVTGEVLRTLPADMLDGWFGLKDFGHYRIEDAGGNEVTELSYPFCLNSYNRQRLSDDSPLISQYPFFCGGGPFTKGSIWGLE